jgi:hypothetical protein
VLDRQPAQRALNDERAERLMTIGGIHVTVALGLLAAIGDISRFASPEKLVSYLDCIRRCANQVTHQPTMDGSASKAALMLAPCLSRPPGRQDARLGRCKPASCASGADAASQWPPSPRPVKSPSWSGIC